MKFDRRTKYCLFFAIFLSFCTYIVAGTTPAFAINKSGDGNAVISIASKEKDDKGDKDKGDKDKGDKGKGDKDKKDKDKKDKNKGNKEKNGISEAEKDFRDKLNERSKQTKERTQKELDRVQKERREKAEKNKPDGCGRQPGQKGYRKDLGG